MEKTNKKFISKKNVRQYNLNKTVPRRIVNLIFAKIFVGELKAGEKLPPDRVMAQQLGVDRN